AGTYRVRVCHRRPSARRVQGTGPLRGHHPGARIRARDRAHHRHRQHAEARRGGAREPLGARRQGRGQRGRGAPMSRISESFARAKAGGRPSIVTYVTAGDPTLERTAGILRALDRAGVTVIEVGVPFSDPLADGPVIQRATERALASGTTLSGVLDLIASVRSEIRAGIVVFSYANPIMRLGAEAFADRAKAAGVDGVLVLDLPLEEAGDFRSLLESRGIDTILLLSPTTTDERLRKAASVGSGFLYAISRLGVTGVRDHVADGAEDMVRRIRAVSDLPVALGFGISKPEHVREVGRWADAAVVGSALVKVIAEAGASADLDTRVEEYVRWLKA